MASIDSVVLRRRPEGVPTADDFELVRYRAPELTDDQIAVEVEFISLDPAMRGWMNDASSYIPPISLGDPIRSIGVGTVTESHSEHFKAGDVVTGLFGVQSHWRGTPDGVRVIDTTQVAKEKYLNPLGMPGQTAYFGIKEVGALRPGETVVVSAAAGAVGSLVGQIAKGEGCTVIGIAGGQAKCDKVVDRYGFDACIDYKQPGLSKRLRELSRGKIDVYFDNVGGEILEAALANLNVGARVVICGAIVGYNDAAPPPAPRNYINLLIKSARMEGFVVFNYFDRHAESDRAMSELMISGQLTSDEQIEVGLDRFAEVFQQLFSGQNTGKLILSPGVS